MNYAKPLLLVASLTLAACSSAPGEVEEPIGSAQQAALNTNALNTNALNTNALNTNALNTNALNTNALNTNGLAARSLEDPLGRELFKYIVSCALPADQSVDVVVDGTTYTFPGGTGLTPEWAQQACDESCQEWVSACVLARVDYLQQPREISLRGVNPALALSPGEGAAYTVREATYYGNIFRHNQRRYACLSPGQTEITRVCGPTLDGCVVDVDASCDKVCDAPTSDGAFQDCKPEDGDRDDRSYHGSITVYLQPGEP
jgi:hypothetical protein